MNRFAIRVWMTAALMICGWLSTVWVRSGYSFEVHPLSRALETLPTELDGYQGTDIPLDEHVREILNADQVVNRQYVRPDGASMIAHASAWVRPESVSSVAPHVPKICYVNAGWRILEERTSEVITPSGKLPISLLLLERDAVRCVVAYWYQMGQSTFLTATEARQIHRKLWGQNQWPATIKVLLQAPGQDIDSALPRIQEFASSVYTWTREI